MVLMMKKPLCKSVSSIAMTSSSNKTLVSFVAFVETISVHWKFSGFLQAMVTKRYVNIQNEPMLGNSMLIFTRAADWIIAVMANLPDKQICNANRPFRRSEEARKQAFIHRW